LLGDGVASEQSDKLKTILNAGILLCLIMVGEGHFLVTIYSRFDVKECMMERPQQYRFHQGEKTLPFSSDEYDARLSSLRNIMSNRGLDACIFTSMHNIAYYSGFLYCSFGRPYGLIVTPDKSITISAGIDAAQPWRRCHGDNITYTDWHRNNFFRSILSVTGKNIILGIEGDQLSITQKSLLDEFLEPRAYLDISNDTMLQRMNKSDAELDLIRQGAAVADIGGYAIKDAVKSGARELDVAMAGRDAMELEIARRFPDSEYRDTWVWFQSGINTDGAHNPVTSRKLQLGDILSLNTFPMISGYYTALERTMFLGEADKVSLDIWEANIAAHEYGISLLKPNISCAEVTQKINKFFEDRGLLQYRTFGYGHSFGVLSHYYGREAGLELREDIDTILKPGMVISMEPMLTIPNSQPGAGGYREHDILIITENGNENITKYPYGPDFNVIA
jgi:creatinase